MNPNGNVLITGTSTGIGRAAALHLDQLGFRVFAGVRKISDGDALCAAASERLTPIIMDVTDAQSIADARIQVSRSVGDAGLAGLVNNAGIALALPLEFTPLDELRRLFDVNVFGLVAVTQAFLPLIRQARGRIVNIGSLMQVTVCPFFGAYAASKLAVGGFNTALRMEMRPFGVQVSLVLPYNVDTPIYGKIDDRAERVAPPLCQDLYGGPFAKMREFFAQTTRRASPPEDTVRAVAHALTAKRARHYYIPGREAQLLNLLITVLPERFYDWVMLRTAGLKG